MNNSQKLNSLRLKKNQKNSRRSPFSRLGLLLFSLALIILLFCVHQDFNLFTGPAPNSSGVAETKNVAATPEVTIVTPEQAALRAASPEKQKISPCAALNFKNSTASPDYFQRLYPKGAAPDSATDQRSGVPNDRSPFSGAATPKRLSPLPGPPPGVVHQVSLPKGCNLVALTFDLCELQTSTSGFNTTLVNMLRREQIPATFFMGGKWMRSHPARTQEILATPYFETGNHAWSHGNFGIMPLDMATSQILWTEGIYEQARAAVLKRLEALSPPVSSATNIPAQLKLFRLPYGRCRPETLQLLHDMGFTVIQWDVVAESTGDNSRPQVLESALHRIKPGSIILLHANLVPKGTTELTSALITRLQQKGVRFVTVSELLAAGTPKYSPDGYFNHPGDNLALDSRFGTFGTGEK